MNIGDKVFVIYEGYGVITSIEVDSIHVKIDSDGIIVAAAFEQVINME